MFDPAQFLDTPLTEANDTKVVPVPVGEYTLVGKEVKVRPWQGKDDPTKAGLALDIIWIIDDASVKEFLGRPEVTVKQGVMLDITESGQLDMGKGKNVGLGKLREALNLNTPGKPFAFNMIPGQVCKGRVEHRISGDQIFAEIKQVARA